MITWIKFSERQPEKAGLYLWNQGQNAPPSRSKLSGAPPQR